jgi:transposase
LDIHWSSDIFLHFNETARQFYQRKKAKANPVVAKKALANKLARACYYVMRDQIPFDNEKLFVT